MYNNSAITLSYTENICISNLHQFQTFSYTETPSIIDAEVNTDDKMIPSYITYIKTFSKIHSSYTQENSQSGQK